VLHWHGKCGFIGGVTPSYDRYSSIVNALGDCYQLLRLPDVDTSEQARAALRTIEHETQMCAELAAGIAMADKLLEAAQTRWRAVDAPHLVALVRAGARFENGRLVEREDRAARETTRADVR
jgi:hypothetical protein